MTNKTNPEFWINVWNEQSLDVDIRRLIYGLNRFEIFVKNKKHKHFGGNENQI